VDAGDSDARPVALLEDVSRKVDLLWQAALANGDYQAFDITEASQAIHRALIILNQCDRANC
jgi:hypothetical protein